MPLSIRRTRQAQLDQNDIWLNIAEDSVRAADSVLERVNAAIFLIAEQPEAGRARPELRAGLRYFPVESYLIFYDVQPGVITIRRVLHGAREIGADFFDT
jgi:toxin ParE1/3/4